MHHTLVEDFDFGIDVNNLRPGKGDLFEAPVEAIEARPVPVPQFAQPPAVKVDVEAVKGQALAAAREEIEQVNLGVIFTYDGETYTVPKPETWDIEIFEAQEEGRQITFLKMLLEDEQWAKFKKVKRVAKDVNGIIEALQAVLGAKPGESRA